MQRLETFFFNYIKKYQIIYVNKLAQRGYDDEQNNILLGFKCIHSKKIIFPKMQKKKEFREFL